jgi:hypothetical protein
MWLRRNVSLKGGQVADFGGKSTGWVVDRAIQVLRDLIGQRNDLLEPVFYPVKRFELSFYRNQVIHLFIEECKGHSRCSKKIFATDFFPFSVAILSTALYATVKAGGPVHNQKILIYPKLESDVSFLSALLKSEFIYGPGGLRENLTRTINHLTDLDVLSVEDEMSEEGTPSGRQFVTLSAEERRIGRETFGKLI